MLGSKSLVTVSTADIFSFTLYKGWTLYLLFVFPILPEVASLLNTSFGEWLVIHYEAFTKIP